MIKLANFNEEIFHNSNGKDYEILAKNGKGDMLLTNNRGQWICAWSVGEDSWGQGHYFDNEKDAWKYWREHYAIKESTEEDYQLLGRLKSDCDYFLGAGDRATKHLWAGSVKEQIEKMYEIWDSLPNKPEWLSREDIDLYARRMGYTNEAIKTDYGPYWYFTSHAVGPGSVPKGITIKKVISVDDGDYFLCDELLTIDELNYYDIKERKPNVTEGRSYGGAYDIADDQFFTKEDVMEFADDVTSSVNYDGDIEIVDLGFGDNNELTITFSVDDYEIPVTKKIDYRRVFKSSDLWKYKKDFVVDLEKGIEDL